MLENEVDQYIQLEAAKFGLILMRNNSGCLPGEDGTPIRFGLHNISKKQNENFKSSDRIGILPITITADMIGQRIGVFVAIEVKRSDWKFNPNDKREVAQKNFIDFIKLRGGIAGFANSVESFLNLLKKEIDRRVNGF